MSKSRNTVSNRKRVVILARSLEVGGAETQLVALAKGLPAHLYDVVVACLYVKGPLIADLQAAGIKILPLEKKGRWDILSFLFRTGKLLKNLQPDIVHSFLTPPNILAALFRNYLAPAKVIWGIRASNMDLSNYDWTWRLTFRIECALSFRPHCIVANSEAGQQYVTSLGFPADKLTVIPNGIDVSRYKNNPEAGIAIREEFGFEASTPVIGIVARLDPMKDHRTFLLAARRLSEQNPDVRFLCVGSGESNFVADLEDFTKELGLQDKVFWAGQRRDLPHIYSALDIVTLTSKYGEGFPNILGEAMACSVPCLGTNIGDTAKVIGDTGVTVPLGNVEEIVLGWDHLLKESTNLRADRRRACRQHIVDTYSLEIMINNHSRLYDQLCSTS
jgi:glycosyltransferase involved in cell wall biosynthesis